MRTLDDGLRRLQEYACPLEDERMREATGRSTHLNQILIINGSLQPQRLNMVIVKEQLGFYKPSHKHRRSRMRMQPSWTKPR